MLLEGEGPCFPHTPCSRPREYVDNRDMDVQDELMFICRGLQESKCMFLQLYNTTPHFIDPDFVRHPVSRVVATCGLHDGRHNRGTLLKTKRYVDIMSDLSRKSQCPSNIRIEGVFRFKGSYPEIIRPQDFFNEDSFRMVLE